MGTDKVATNLYKPITLYTEEELLKYKEDKRPAPVKMFLGDRSDTQWKQLVQYYYQLTRVRLDDNEDFGKGNQMLLLSFGAHEVKIRGSKLESMVDLFIEDKIKYVHTVTKEQEYAEEKNAPVIYEIVPW